MWSISLFEETVRLSESFFKTYVLSYFLPSAVFVSFQIYCLLPYSFNYKFHLFPELLASFQNQLLLMLIFSAFTGFFFMSSSSYLVRLFEGYSFDKILFPFFKLLRWLQRRKVKKYLKRLIPIQRKINITKSRQDRQWHSDESVNIRGDLLLYFSGAQEELMPTSLGNIFKAFEKYADMRYRIDLVVLWPRLVKTIPENYTNRLEEANNSMIFLLVSCLLFALMGIECLILSIFKIGSGEFLLVLKWLAPISLIMSFMSYRISLRAALNYGEVVKSCFDLFRHDMLKSFGIERRLTLNEERQFWYELRKFILAGEGDPFAKFQNAA